MPLRKDRQRNFKQDLPEFFEEVRGLLLKIDRNDLAGQLKDLAIVYMCPCTNFGCASFKVAGSSTPDTFEIPGQRGAAPSTALSLNAAKGKITIVTDQLGRITAFEVLDRQDIRKQLLRL